MSDDPIVRSSTLDWGAIDFGKGFASKHRRLGTLGKRISCGEYIVAPGQRAFPMHYHMVNEEAIYVLEGTGTLRLGDQEYAVGPGDWIAMPAGPDHVHQLINSGDIPLRYLCMATNDEPEVCLYPDSDKVGVFHFAKGFRKMYKVDSELSYLHDEPDHSAE